MHSVERGGKATSDSGDVTPIRWAGAAVAA